ncbi:SH3 domain-containing C40 family peptidase [Clostridiaceae bacterium M8S5]|nr:SH3 domain-containing C40 family peptidase [Clostridiaceae bacterium M8S5]
MSEYAVVKNPVVSIKGHPKSKGEHIDEVLLGMVVEVLWEDVNDFLFVQTDYNYKGYVKKGDLIRKYEEVTSWRNNNKVIVTGGYVDITQDTSYNSYIIKSVVKGTYLKNLSEVKANRLLVELPDGSVGWIRNKYVKERVKLDFSVNEDEIRNNIVITALQYLKTQFRWGGKTPLGVDSSGLTSIVYLINEIAIYRDAELMHDYFVDIGIEDIKKGDVLFFPEHTAIYIGEDKFIHSSSIDSGVVIHSLNPEDENYKGELISTLKKIGKYKGFK